MKTIDLLARQMPTTRATRLPRPDHPHSREGLCGVGPNTLKLNTCQGGRLAEKDLYKGLHKGLYKGLYKVGR